MLGLDTWSLMQPLCLAEHSGKNWLEGVTHGLYGLDNSEDAAFLLATGIHSRIQQLSAFLVFPNSRQVCLTIPKPRPHLGVCIPLICDWGSALAE